MCATMEAGTGEFEITLNMRVICEKNSLCEVNPHKPWTSTYSVERTTADGGSLLDLQVLL